MKKIHTWSIFILSVGVLVNAIFIPTYTGAAFWTSKEMIPLINLRSILGLSANTLIVLGTIGQLIFLFSKKDN